ncbi:MAG: nuclear transport factor 2 family protein, partial [Acidobacteriaceae bacterium]|nr:nuclear transport factor 2 family protein [Acidobacteriaceae bacterium]
TGAEVVLKPLLDWLQNGHTAWTGTVGELIFELAASNVQVVCSSESELYALIHAKPEVFREAGVEVASAARQGAVRLVSFRVTQKVVVPPTLLAFPEERPVAELPQQDLIRSSDVREHVASSQMEEHELSAPIFVPSELLRPRVLPRMFAALALLVLALLGGPVAYKSYRLRPSVPVATSAPAAEVKSATATVRPDPRRTSRTSQPRRNSDHSARQSRPIRAEDVSQPIAIDAPAQLVQSSLSAQSGAANEAARALLARWVEAFRGKNIPAYLSCYAPSLTIYYTRHNVNRALVQSEVQRFFRRYPAVAQFDLRNINVTSLGPDQIRVVFEKTWDVSGTQKFAGREMQELMLIRDLDNAWRISSEHELRVLKLIRQ